MFQEFRHASALATIICQTFLHDVLEPSIGNRRKPYLVIGVCDTLYLGVEVRSANGGCPYTIW